MYPRNQLARTSLTNSFCNRVSCGPSVIFPSGQIERFLLNSKNAGHTGSTAPWVPYSRPPAEAAKYRAPGVIAKELSAGSQAGHRPFA
jgi:hypothetical protein